VLFLKGNEMHSKTFLWTLLLMVAVVILPGCQAARVMQNASTKSGTASLSTLAPSPTAQVTSTKQATAPLDAASTATIPLPVEQNQGDEAVAAAQAYFTAVSEGKSDAAAKLLSTFSLAVFQITRGDATEALQAQKIAGVRWSDLKILGTQPFDDQTMLVHITYSETLKADATATPEPTPIAAANTVDALWPMRLERGEWRYNWKNVIDFRTMDVAAQTISDITILPTQLTRYSDRIELCLLIQNRKNEVVVFGQVNETLGTFYFGDQTVIAEKTRWILNPLRAVPDATLEIKGLFTSLPDKVEIRKWNNLNVQPWYTFQL
jgi:hypothetical protein